MTSSRDGDADENHMTRRTMTRSHWVGGRSTGTGFDQDQDDEVHSVRGRMNCMTGPSHGGNGQRQEQDGGRE